MKTLGSRVYLPGRSDTALLRTVTGTSGFVASAKTLSPAIGLQHGVSLRPFEVLHELAYVTRPRYLDDLRDLYAHWGLLRYLGFFELTDPGRSSSEPLSRLKLSPSGRSIVGTKRRVASEELGIAFGAILARRWFEQTGAAGTSISIVDIDDALDHGYIFAGGARLAVRRSRSRRPDYLLVSRDPAAPSRYRIRVLECKGTRNPRVAAGQLARALSQLDGITVGGRVPAGLASAVITSDHQVSYLAIDPADEEEPSYEVDSRTIRQAADFRMEGDWTDLPPAQLIGAAVRTSWASLADFGDNFDALQRWAPEAIPRRADRQSGDRLSFETPFGTARGTAITFNLDRNRLTVRYAIDETVDRGLSEGTVEGVTEAQAGFADRLSRAESQLSRAVDRTSENELYSAKPDGSIFSLKLE
jgi:hypothetical protein